MTCEKPYDLVAYLKAELPDAERAACKAHFESCGVCLKEIARLDSTLKALGRMPKVEPAPDFKWRVREAFVQAHPDFTERLRTTDTVARPRSLWQAIKEQFAGAPAWAVSVAVHILLLSIATMLFLGPRGEDPDRTTLVNAKNRHRGDAPQFPKDKSGTGLGTIKPDPGEGPMDISPGPHDTVRPGPKDRPRPSDRPIDVKPWEHLMRPVRESAFLAFLPSRTTGKAARAKAGGGDGAPEAVRRALAWLASVQSSDGKWDPALLGGDPAYEVGITGLATLAFLADGQTHKSGEHAAAVKRALAWLQGQQKMSGLVGEERGNYLYNHALGSLALLEASMMTGDEALVAPVQLAVTYALQAQNSAGLWDYVVRGEHNDMSVSGWMVLLLRLAFENGNRAVVSALSLANERISELRDAEGRVGYRSRGQFPNGPYGTTAVGSLAYLLSTPIPDPAVTSKQAALLVEGLRAHPVSPEPADMTKRDLYFWYFGSLTLHQLGGIEWTEWNRTVKDPLLRAQQADGSWPRAYDRWASYGGQAYTTAMASLTLSTYWRYPAFTK